MMGKMVVVALVAILIANRVQLVQNLTGPGS
jgi:hypothetical protein